MCQCLVWPIILPAQVATNPASGESVLLTIEGKVEVSGAGTTTWTPGQTNGILHIADRVRTGLRSRAAVRLSNLSVLRVNELTTLQIQPPSAPGKQSRLDLGSGSTYFLSRERPTDVEFRTPLASGAIRGTEFHLFVAENGRSVVTLIDGVLTLSNPQGTLDLGSGEQATVEPGQAPTKTAVINAINIIQWCLYYPGILEINEVGLSAAEQQLLSASLNAYRSGDLLAALANYPQGRTPQSDAERIYFAGLLLAVGQVEQSEAQLGGLTRASPLADALREVVAAVKFQNWNRTAPPVLATEWLAESYYLQSRSKLDEALKAARMAVSKTSSFGFGWARVAELEFSFGRVPAAVAALENSLQLSPRNAEALTVRGYLLASQNRITEAQRSFEEALAVDGALGNAWLGHGLVRIRQGDAAEGVHELQVAATLEPQRSLLRSYLGKAFSNAGDNRHAGKELKLAQTIDPNDPTPFLYSALLEQEDNEINQAVRDLEKSEKLNDNRRLFRSRLLLDEDQAVRSANLAGIYQDAGMVDWSVREASRAVNYDYANYSAHQFLSSSYDALRDPRQINLRYETPWFNELLLANLLAPVSGGNLSQYISQQEYSKLFEQNRFGLSSETEYLSHGDWLERGSQYGIWDNTSYAVDAEYRSQRGWRPNNGLEQLTISVKAKQQLTPHDSLFILGLYYDTSFGDEAQYYNQDGTINGAPAPSRTFRGFERQEPNIFVGYHHEWGPGSHTLLLAGHLDDTLQYSDPQAKILFTRYLNDQIAGVRGDPFSVNYHRDFDAYTAELQQIWQTPWQTMVAGGRYQSGWSKTFSHVDNPLSFPSLVSQDEIKTDLERYTIYGYETVHPVEPLQLTAGISYDHLHYPRDIDTSPITKQEADIDQISPKAGMIWRLLPDTYLRFAYTRSLGGVFYDTSVRLEPTQVAGFNEAFRSIIPESVVGLVPGTHFTTYGVGLDTSFKSNTYLSIDAEILDSDGQRTVGVVTNSFFLPIANSPGNTRQSLDFTEQSLVMSLNQLVGKEWSLGARYQLSHAMLNGRFIDIPLPVASTVNQDERALLHQLILYLNYYHPCGFFAQAQSLWTAQENHGYTPALPGDDFWQFNFFAGYRFLNRAAEVKVGLLNATDENYKLNPLNLYYELPRGRTVAVSFRFYF